MTVPKTYLLCALTCASLSGCNAAPIDERPVTLAHQDQEFRTGWWGWGHPEITEAGLFFVDEDVREDIVEANVDIDGPLTCAVRDCGSTKLDSRYHFDNCRVQEALDLLGHRYNALVDVLGANSPDFNNAAKRFGSILHTTQDFFAHSNWVDAQRTALLGERGFLPPTVAPGGKLGSMVLVAEPMPYLVTREADSRIPRVLVDGVWRDGLITGTYDKNTNGSICPNNAAIPHGDPFNQDDDELFLAKDDPDTPNHQKAVDIATDQTTEEMCRLVRLVTLRHGMTAREALLNAWVTDRGGYDAACPDDLSIVTAVWLAAL